VKAPSASALSEGLEARYQRERVLWLSTTGPDGAPHLVPIWFVWDGDAFLVFSKPNAVKVRHIATEPRVAVALGSPEDDFDVQLVDAEARLLDRPTCEVLPVSLLRKYRRQMRGIGLDPATFAQTYSQPIRITPTRFLPWRGRTWLEGRTTAA
jgi:PPOX class probable F420-dependent enzyme